MGAYLRDNVLVFICVRAIVQLNLSFSEVFTYKRVMIIASSVKINFFLIHVSESACIPVRSKSLIRLSLLNDEFND